ncbi:hypothetical protein CFIMG_007773RA00001 [Ceratocystis fimbriata CBS 114723]|uniref:SET domain-containing protein n=1 Tax=Ceratocystis fimbriata CBS 114723 TaxID=1035309 RepID=A0A2C5XLN7_9PEZI|nr:hypothetical protein CFIMG_007773RA00001 [Ceratocystis fimbriata CBS 114723]
MVNRESLLAYRQSLTNKILGDPYDLVTYLQRADIYLQLGYPDLAAGDAYRALNLTDEVLNEGYEYHKQASQSLEKYMGNPMVIPATISDWVSVDEVKQHADNHADSYDANTLALLASVRCFQVLSSGLWMLGCLQKAVSFCQRGLVISPDNTYLKTNEERIHKTAAVRLKRKDASISTYPDWGLARREVYPWNSLEPDRTSLEALERLNHELSFMAPKCIVKTTELPALHQGEAKLDKDGNPETCFQLGVFAKEDIAAGESVLHEYSLLTASNRLKESICDACGTELPPLGQDSTAVNCEECYDTVFCDQFCHDQAQEKYHPAVCERDVDSIARDVDAQEADEALHLLLLARVLAMASHQEIHPLDVLEIKYIWGDFVPATENDVEDVAAVVESTGLPPKSWTLPFNFEYNIEMPLHILEKMDIDVFKTVENHDTWVFNSVLSKTRGTASARKNSRDGRPEVAAVHPFWCLANHDCNPNVTWEWGGRMTLWAREKRVVGDEEGNIRKGEEILNHYCDVTLPVQERREWACGSLGGWCMCDRCKREANEI